MPDGLQPAGVILQAQNADAYLRTLAQINKAQRETFDPGNFRAFNDALKQAGDAYKNLPKSLPPLKLPKVEPIKSNILGDLTKNLDEAITKGDFFQQTFDKVKNFFGGQFLSTITRVGGVLAAVFSVDYAINFAKGLEQAAVAANSQFENFTVQFTTLLGSTAEAKKRIKELAEFGVKTPYELPNIVSANRLLQTFGGTVLATGDNLRRIGDAAAAVSQPFESVAFWFGRMYSAMKNGQPFGEASARLQELGILSGDTRIKLEKMQKEGKTGAEIWEFYAGVIDEKFAGAMDRLSKTLQGVQSNIADFQGQLLREGGLEYFETLREQTIRFYDIISDDEASEALLELAKAFGHVGAELRKASIDPLLAQLEATDWAEVKELGGAVSDLGTAVGKLQGDEAAEGINGFINGLTSGVQAATSLMNVLGQVNKMVDKVGLGLLSINKIIKSFEALNMVGLLNPLTSVYKTIKDLTGTDLLAWMSETGNAYEEAAQAAYETMRGMQAEGAAAREAAEAESLAAAEAEALAAAEEAAAKAADELKASLENQIEVLEATKDAYKRIKDIQQDYQDAQADAKAEYDKGMAEAEQKFLEERERKIAEFNKKLVEFDAESARKRQQMIDEFEIAQQNRLKEFNLQRVQAEQDYNLRSAQEKRKFYDDQKKALRDFQLSQMQAQRQFSVTDRRLRAEGDVLALMEAREDFALQQQENKENFRNQNVEAKDAFSEQQRVAEENFKLQEEQARASFAMQTEMQREEFQRRLQEFDENIALQREQMIAAHQQELLDLEAKFEEEKIKLKEQYDERMAMAEEQRDKQLQALGDSLKEEGKVTEEGMKDIASKISEVFGDEGAGDQLIKGWSERTENEINNVVDNIQKDIERLKQALESGTPVDLGKGIGSSSPGASAGFGSNPSTIGGGGGGGKVIGAREGFNGVVTGPKTFQVEPGVREHVAFTPMNRFGGNIKVSGSTRHEIFGTDASTASRLGDDIANQLLEEIRIAIRKLGRTRGS